MSNENKKEYTCIAYTDGSAMPNPGFYGSGAHAYFYTDDGMGVKNVDKPLGNDITNRGYNETGDKKITEPMLTSYIGKGISLQKYSTELYKLWVGDANTETVEEFTNLLNSDVFVVKPEFYLNMIESYAEVGTNNRGEVLALIGLIETIKKEEINVSKIICHSDSEYLLAIFKGISNDKERKWFREDRPNIDLWLLLESEYQLLEHKGVDLEVKWVKGHSTNLGNNIADRLAYLARYKSSLSKSGRIYKINPGKKYWKPGFNKHPFIDFRQLFFNNHHGYINPNGLPEYLIMNYKRDVETGKKSNEAMLGVVQLTSGIDIINNIIDEHNKAMQKTSILSSVNLPEVYSQNHQLFLENFGSDIYTFNPRNNTMLVLEERAVTSNVTPVGLANNAMHKTMRLRDILTKYLAKDNEPEFRRYVDITDSIFKENDTGKTKCILPNGEKFLTVDFKYDDVEMTNVFQLGIDCIDRNHLRKIEKLKPKVTLVLDKRSDDIYEYYIIVETLENYDAGIFCNVYTNKVFPKALKKKKKK